MLMSGDLPENPGRCCRAVPNREAQVVVDPDGPYRTHCVRMLDALLEHVARSHVDLKPWLSLGEQQRLREIVGRAAQARNRGDIPELRACLAEMEEGGGILGRAVLQREQQGAESAGVRAVFRRRRDATACSGCVESLASSSLMEWDAGVG